MIRYRKTIQLKTNRNGDLSLETDLGQTWRTLQLRGKTAITDWIFNSAQGNLQHWQKDMSKIVLDSFVHEIQDEHPYTIYQVYQKGQGYQSKVSDVFLMRIQSHNVWFVSTSEHTWIVEESLENFPLNTDLATGSILNETVRKQLYDWSDSLRGIKTKKQSLYTEKDYQAKGLEWQ